MSQNKSQSEIRKPKGLSQFNKSEGIELDKVTWVVSSTGQLNGGSFGSSDEGCTGGLGSVVATGFFSSGGSGSS
jgi:hypothetical protein